MLMAKYFVLEKALKLPDFTFKQNEIKAGSKETEVKELAVNP